MSWSVAETNTHQDHVIAHVIGATPLAHFVRDETAFVMLDIGFIWNIYLDMQMGLLPERAAIGEFELVNAVWSQNSSVGPIESVEVFEAGDERRLELNCESGKLLIETSLKDRWTRIESAPIDS